LDAAARPSIATPDKSRRIPPLRRPLCRPLVFGSLCPPLRSEPDRSTMQPARPPPDPIRESCSET
jgi:hypothetical protein